MMRIAAANWLRLCVVLAALGMASTRAQAAPNFSLSFDSKGETAQGVIPDPADCFGPESSRFATVLLRNVDETAVSANLSVVASPGWHFEAGSCQASLGLCEIVDPQDLQWSTPSLDPGDQAIILFALRVDSDTPAGTQLCIDLTAQFDGDSPLTQRFCETTNSARQCGLGAPVAGTHGLALLAAALMLGGVVVLRRRTR